MILNNFDMKLKQPTQIIGVIFCSVIDTQFYNIKLWRLMRVLRFLSRRDAFAFVCTLAKVTMIDLNVLLLLPKLPTV